MTMFFTNTRPGRAVTFKSAAFHLPILYFRDDFFGLLFTADPEKAKTVMPSDRLFPVILPTGKAVVAVFAANYTETSIGSYGEVAVAIPAVYGKKTSPISGILPALMESRYPGFGMLVVHLPVTRVEARDAGRGEWGYAKFVADMHFDIMPEYMACKLSEGTEHILDLRVRRKGFYIKDRKPITTFSVKNNRLIKTVIPQKGTKRISLSTTGSFLQLGQHEMAQTIRDLGISPRPFMTWYYPERSAVLPSGEVLEEGARALDGYMGKRRDAKHTIAYDRHG